MYPASVEYLNRQRIIPKLRQWTLGATVDLGFAVCNRLVSDLFGYPSLVFSACYHWWICLLVWLLSSFFFNYFLKFFYFNNIFLFLYLFIIITLFYFTFFFFCFLSFISPFSSEPCGWKGLGAPARCQAWALEVREPSSGHWTTRDLLAPCNYQSVRALPEISVSTLRPSSTQWPASSSAGHPMPNN